MLELKKIGKINLTWTLFVHLCLQMQWGQSQWGHLKDSSWNLCWFQEDTFCSTWMSQENLGDVNVYKHLELYGEVVEDCNCIWYLWPEDDNVEWGCMGGGRIKLDKSMERLWQILCKLQLCLQTYLLCDWLTIVCDKEKARPRGLIKDKKGSCTWCSMLLSLHPT